MVEAEVELRGYGRWDGHLTCIQAWHTSGQGAEKARLAYAARRVYAVFSLMCRFC